MAGGLRALQYRSVDIDGIMKKSLVVLGKDGSENNIVWPDLIQEVEVTKTSLRNYRCGVYLPTRCWQQPKLMEAMQSHHLQCMANVTQVGGIRAMGLRQHCTTQYNSRKQLVWS